MGGCASKPKEFDSSAEAPVNSETNAQSNTNGGESQIEKPAVDGSEPEKEAKTLSPEAVSTETDVAKTVKPTEDDVRTTTIADENAEAKVELETTTKPPVKEAEEAEHKSIDALPSEEDVQSEAPLVSL